MGLNQWTNNNIPTHKLLDFDVFHSVKDLYRFACVQKRSKDLNHLGVIKSKDKTIAVTENSSSTSRNFTAQFH